MKANFNIYFCVWGGGERRGGFMKFIHGNSKNIDPGFTKGPNKNKNSM